MKRSKLSPFGLLVLVALMTTACGNPTPEQREKSFKDLTDGLNSNNVPKKE